MIEAIILDYLKRVLSVPCYMEKPENPPESYCIIEKTGSDYSNLLYSAMFAIQSYAPSMYKAAELNLAVKRAMENITELDDITHCELNSDYNYTDTAKKGYRYQAVFDISHYKE